MRKATVTINFEYKLFDDSDEASVETFIRRIRDYVDEGHFITRADPENNRDSLIYNNGSCHETTIYYTDFPSFLEKYGKFLNTYDIARVLLDYGCGSGVKCKIEEIPEPPKEEACSGT